MKLEQLQAPPRWRRVLLLVLLFLAVTSSCAFLDQSRLLRYAEHFTDSLKTAVYAKKNGSLAEEARKRVMLVTISDDTFKTLPGPPVPRNYHAKVIRDLTRAGARVIAFDLIFDASRKEDTEFATAAQATGNVVWACAYDTSATGASQIILPNRQLYSASPHLGHVQVPIDPERPAIDRIEAVKTEGGRTVPALALQAALLANGRRLGVPTRTTEGWQINDLYLPVDKEGYFTISYMGKPDETFPIVPYEQICQGAVDDPFYSDNHFFRNKVVLIGDITTLGNDYHTTQVGEMAGMEIHAHAIATLLQRSAITTAPPWLSIAILAVLSLCICLAATRCSLPWVSVISAVLLLGYLYLNVLLFVDYRLNTHLSTPLLAIVLTAVGAIAERSMTEEREKRRMLGLLQRYVSPQVAKYVVEHLDEVKLGGQLVEATILFSDIRGFTTMSEKLQPEQVVSLLNEYLQAMTDVIFRHEGTIDKYIGDAIMALFGFPIHHADHTRRAVATAFDMMHELKALQARWGQQGLPRIDIGIGIHTGKMVVGNIGGRQRFDFTAIGDTVNLASRVEHLNKELQTHILLTADAYAQVRDIVQVGEPYSEYVAGKEAPVVVYEALGFQPPNTADHASATSSPSK